MYDRIRQVTINEMMPETGEWYFTATWPFFLGEQVEMSGEKLHNQSIQSEGYNLCMFKKCVPFGVLFWSWKSMCFPFLHGVLLPGWTTGHNKVEVIRQGKVDLLSHQWMRDWPNWKHKPLKNRNDLHDERILGTWIGTGGRALTLRIRSGDVGENLKSRMSINITIYIYII